MLRFSGGALNGNVDESSKYSGWWMSGDTGKESTNSHGINTTRSRNAVMGWKNDLRASWKLRPLGGQRRRQRSPSDAPLWIDLQRWGLILVPPHSF